MNFSISSASMILLLSVFSSCQSPQVGIPPKPSAELQKALADFEIADGFKIELVAAEPLIADPVAMEIDEDGRMYVVEMHGYPLDLSGTGKVKLLKDTNGDGYPDKSVVFADSLKLPTGIMQWRKGILVTDPPHVWYLEDTNGDDKADIRRPILTGFALSNPQHNLNNPVFGVDNWIYLAHEWAITPMVCKKEFADEGSEISFPDKPNAAKLNKNADDRNVRFKPDSYEIEALSGETQFGQTFDPWGHHFLTENAKHLYHEAIAARYLKRNPNLLISDATQTIADHGDACEVFPVTENPHHQLLTDVGVITSACGVTWYNGGAFPEPFNQNTTFVGEPVHNLVHVDKIKDNGASFVASRIVEKKEFLASKDAWFRPVNFYVGPDGALYVVDYYRQIVEHPEWMSDEVNKSGELYNGTDKGRIYRIVPKNGLPMDWLGKLNLSKKTDEQLVALLENKNAWWRKTAQRLLFQRKTKTIEPIRQIALSANLPEARVHALWLLDGLKALDKEVLIKNLEHNVAGVRENAIKLTENYILNNPSEEIKLYEPLLALANDASEKVRYQLLCTSSVLKNTQKADKAIGTVLTRDIKDKWVHIAALAASSGRETQLLAMALKQLADKETKAQESFFAYAAATIANSKNPESIRQLMSLALDAKANGTIRASLLTGLQQLWSRTGVPIALTDQEKKTLLDQFTSQNDPALRHAALQLLRVVGLPQQADHFIKTQALPVITNQQANEAFRSDAIYLLSLITPMLKTDLVQTLVKPQEPLNVQFAALQTMSQVTDNEPCVYLFNNWKTLNNAVQDKAIDVLLKREKWAHLLLDAVAKGTVSSEHIGWRRMVRLMNNDDVGVRAHARKVLASSGLTREAVLASYQPSLSRQGNAANGAKVFERVCATCHQLNGKGISFGPELNSLRNRPTANILESILIPNRTIADKFEYWHVELKNGTSLDGILTAKTPASYTLRLLGGQEQLVAKSEVKALSVNPNSAMPDGLEASISVSEMSDLLAYIKGMK